MDNPTYFTWADVPETEFTSQIRRRLISGQKVMLVKLSLDQGAIVGQHSHPHEQVSYVFTGALEFTINDQKRVAYGGDVVVIPSNAPHAVVVLEQAEVLDIFSPPREDFLTTETPAYMK
jgi:quercetin dioxygenase-like cupin family protein